MAKKKLKIAQFVTSQRKIPPDKGAIWAPIDLALDIAKGVTKNGHSMTFYAPKASRVPYKVVSGNLKQGIYDKAFFQNIRPERKKMPFGIPHMALYDAYMIRLMMRDADRGKYDVVHIHTERGLPFLDYHKTPAVITLHDPINPYAARAYRLFNNRKMHLVSISNSQREPAPDLNYAATIYNGIEPRHFKFSDKPTDKFLFCSRLIPQKGVEDAIAAAKARRARLDIVGRHYDPRYLKTVKALCTARIRYRGNIDRDKLSAVYGAAKALLFPIKWPEPFGLVMVEAMSCGTPVIAYDRGSVREVVQHGVTGYIVRNKSQMIAAMKKIDRIDRRACRKWVEDEFSTSRMVEEYEKLYARASRQWGKKN